MSKNKKGKNRKINITPDILKQLQDAMNDKLKPDHKERKDGGKKRHKTPKKEKIEPSNGSSECDQSQRAM